MQVEGCGVELINEKTYYKRYRICSEHCVMPLMVIDGRRQRFCQQCGRFHDISEFEGQRKSCRRKLKRHNERRRSGPTKGRKWQSDSDDEYSVDDGEGEAEIVAKIKRTSVRMRSGRSKGLATSSEDVSESTPCPTEPLAPAGAPSDKQPPQLRSLAERLLHAARDMVGLPAESVSPFAAVAGQPAASADTSQDGSNPVAMLTSAIGTATDGEAVGEPSTQLDVSFLQAKVCVLHV